MAEAAGGGPERLSELLESGWRLLEEVESGAEPSSGAAPVQRKVQRGLELLDRAAAAVAQLELFSRNEELEEIPSADLRFMLVPALRAALTLRRGGPERRLEALRRARALFVDFLRVSRDYGVSRFELPREPEDEESGAAGSPRPRPRQQPSLLAMAACRQAKIERYKQKKEVENQLASLRPFVDSGQAEEDQIRDYYLLQIKKWISTSLEEIESIDQETAILNRRNAMQDSATQPCQPPRPPMRPFILTRDAAQAKYINIVNLGGILEGGWPCLGSPVAVPAVSGRLPRNGTALEETCLCRVFGAGYPSLATMTVDEWYEQHQKQGVLPDQGISQRASGSEDQQKGRGQSKEEEEEKEEEEAAVLKAREWDEWKDVHPRGYGNRKNMG